MPASAPIPPLTEAGAAQLMELLEAKGYFMRDGFDSLVIATDPGTYATTTYLSTQLAQQIVQLKPAGLLDVVDASSKLRISTEQARHVLSSMHSHADLEVQPIKSQTACNAQESMTLLIINKTAMNNFVRQSVANLYISVTRAIALSELVENTLYVPTCIMNQSVVRLEATELLQKMLLQHYSTEPGITIVKGEKDTLILTEDYMSTAQFPRALRQAISELREPKQVIQLLSETDSPQAFRPDLDWIVERLVTEGLNGQFARVSRRNRSEQHVFVPDCYLKSLREKMLGDFEVTGIWNKDDVIDGLDQWPIALVDPCSWLREAYPDATFLRNAVVREDIVKALSFSIHETNSWLDVQPFIPGGLQEEDILVLMDHILEDKSLGEAVAMKGNCLFFSRTLIEFVEKELIHELVRGSAGDEAKKLVQLEDMSVPKHESKKRDKRRKGKERIVTTDGRSFHVDDIKKILPIPMLTDALLDKLPELSGYVREKAEGKERREIVCQLIQKTFYTGDQPLICDIYGEIVQEELESLRAEHSVSKQRRLLSQDAEFIVAFEDPRCFASACYMIQMATAFVEYFETTVAKDNPADQESLEAIRQDILQTLCADFARRLTIYCLMTHHGDSDSLIEFTSDENIELAPYCSPIPLASRAFPSIHLVFPQEKKCDEPSGRLDALRPVLEPTVYKSLSRLLMLAGENCSGNRFCNGDLQGFLSHLKEECITICGMPFKVLDKKSKKQLLNDRRQLLIKMLQNETEAKAVLEFAVMHLFQHVKNLVVFGKHLHGPVLQALLREKKVTEKQAAALLSLAEAVENGDHIDPLTIERVKSLSLGNKDF